MTLVFMELSLEVIPNSLNLGDFRDLASSKAKDDAKRWILGCWEVNMVV